MEAKRSKLKAGLGAVEVGRSDGSDDSRSSQLAVVEVVSVNVDPSSTRLWRNLARRGSAMLSEGALADASVEAMLLVKWDAFPACAPLSP